MTENYGGILNKHCFDFSGQKHNYQQEYLTYDDLFHTIKLFEDKHPYKKYKIPVYLSLKDGGEEESNYIAGIHIYISPEEANKDIAIIHSHEVFDTVRQLLIHDKAKKNDTAVIFDEDGKAYNIIKVTNISSNSITFWKDEYEYDGKHERFFQGDEVVILYLICKPVE